MRARNGIGVSPPTRVKLPLSISRSSFACSGGGMSPISSRNSVPRAGALGIAEMALLRPGEGALLVAEDLALEKLRRDCRAVDGDEGLGAARRDLVQQAGRHFLARPGFAGDQHRQIVARVATELRSSALLDRRRLAEQ